MCLNGFIRGWNRVYACSDSVSFFKLDLISSERSMVLLFRSNSHTWRLRVWREIQKVLAQSSTWQLLQIVPFCSLSFVFFNTFVCVSYRYRSPAFHVQAWYDEVKDYTYPYPSECNPWCPERCSGPMCTHYTQVRRCWTTARILVMLICNKETRLFVITYL